MSSPRFGRLVAPLLLIVTLTACGRSASSTEPVHAGAPVGSPTAPAPTTTTTGPTTTGPTTTTVAGDAGPPDPSPVANLTPTDLRRVVEAPGPRSTRSLAGPTADRVTVSGRTVWRVRIPGRFAVRDARVEVLAGDRVVGIGIVGPGLTSLVAVTEDGAGLVPGAPVSYRWEGAAAVSAGSLAVVR